MLNKKTDKLAQTHMNRLRKARRDWGWKKDWLTERYDVILMVIYDMRRICIYIYIYI